MTTMSGLPACKTSNTLPAPIKHNRTKSTTWLLISVMTIFKFLHISHMEYQSGVGNQFVNLIALAKLT